MTVLLSTIAFTRSLFLIAALDMMSPAGISIRQVTISHSLAANKTGQLDAKAMKRLTENAINRPVKYNRLIFSVLSMISPAGNERIMRIISPILVRRAIFEMLAPRVLMYIEEYCPPMFPVK